MPKAKSRTASPNDLASAAFSADSAAPSGELGPAVTQEFQDALGLHDLAGRSTGRSSARHEGTAAPSPAAPVPAPPAVDYSKLIHKMLQLADTAISAALHIPPESGDDLETPADCITPWVQAHAGDVTNETGMRLLALSGLITLIAMKVVKWSNKPKPVPARPNVAAGGAPEDRFAEMVVSE